MLHRADTIRPARPDDAPHLARLVNLAGEGMPFVLWSGMAKAGEDPWDIGAARARRDHGSFSWRNAHVAEASGTVAAALVTYRIGGEPEPIDRSTMPPAFVALQELENLALDTQYVNVLATYPDFRSRGLGTRLLKTAEALADGRSLSIIVSDDNAPAKRLYEQQGYAVIAARKAEGLESWQPTGRHWLLMIK